MAKPETKQPHSLSSPSLSVSEFIRRYFADSNGFDKETFVQLLSAPEGILEDVFSRLSYAARPLLGGYLPREWGRWRSVKDEPSPDSILLALRWHLYRLTYHGKTLAPLIAMRREIENRVFNGQYNEALSSLESFEKRGGKSLWSLSAFFRICELQNGTHFNRTQLTLFIDDIGNGKWEYWTKYLATIFSLRCETSLSTDEYNSTLRYLDIRGNEFNEYAIAYLKFRLRDECPTSDKEIVDILHFESRHSILDLHDTFIRVLSLVESVKLPRPYRRKLLEYCSTVDDETLWSVARHHQVIEVPSTTQDFQVCREAADALYLGNFENSYKKALATIARFPRHFIGYYVAGLSSAHLRSEPQSEGMPRPQKDLIAAVYQWFSPDADRAAAIEQLHSLARLHAGTTLGWGILEFASAVEEMSPSYRPDAISILASPCPIPQQALSHHDTNRAKRYLNTFSSDEKRGFVYSSVEESLGAGTHERLDNCEQGVREYRRLHLLAIRSATRGDFSGACETLATLRQKYPSYYITRPDAEILEATCLFEVNHVEAAATLTASLYAEYPESVPPALLKKFAALVGDDQFVYTQSNIAWPIIVAIARRQYLTTISLDRVHDFVSDYIESQGYFLPTDLIAANTPTLTREQFIFLRDCCTVDIMESSFWIGSQEDLIKERLNVCEALRRSMPSPPIGIEGEIGLLMRKLAVLDITQRVERSRIYVDTDKIKERAPEHLSGTVTRLLVLVAVRNKEVNRSLKLLGMPNRDGGNVLLVSVDRDIEMFTSVFSSLREEYLFSPELGLDANLSQAIRHGPIIGGIRSVFDRSQLITRTTSDGRYHSNAFWLNQLIEAGGSANLVDGCFSQLAHSVDQFIKQVREVEIQIKTIENPQGLFDYDFSDDELEHAFSRIEPLHEVEDVYDIALDVLTERTEVCLRAIRERISSDWEKGLQKLLSDFLAQIECAVTDSGRLSQLRSAVTDATTEIARGLANISGWFGQEDRRESKSFPIQSLVNTLEQVAQKGGQRCTVRVNELENSKDQRISGFYFRPLWDLFFILFDNALKHGGLEETVLFVNVEVDNLRTRFVVSNSVSAEIDLNLLREKVEQLNSLSLDRSSDLSKLRSEGGSGIAKLHKIARYEIGNDNTAYTIQLLITEEKLFQVEIIIEKGIIDECLLG